MITFFVRLMKFALWVVVRMFSIVYMIVLTPILIFWIVTEHMNKNSRFDTYNDELSQVFAIVVCADMIDALTDRLAWWKEADTDGHDI